MEIKHYVVFPSFVSTSTAVLRHCWEKKITQNPKHDMMWYFHCVFNTIKNMFMHWEMFQRYFQRQWCIQLSQQKRRHTGDECVMGAGVLRIWAVALRQLHESVTVLSAEPSQYCFQPWTKTYMRAVFTVVYYINDARCPLQ